MGRSIAHEEAAGQVPLRLQKPGIRRIFTSCPPVLTNLHRFPGCTPTPVRSTSAAPVRPEASPHASNPTANASCPDEQCEGNHQEPIGREAATEMKAQGGEPK